MKRRPYNEKEDEWCLKMQTLEVVTFCLFMLTLITGYGVMEYHLTNTPLFEVSLFLCVATALSFSYTLYVGSKGTLKGYERGGGEND